MAIVNANDFVIKSADTSAGTKEIFAHAQNASLSFSNSLIEITNKDSSSWKEHISGMKSYSISSDGLIDYATVTNAQNFEDLMDLAIAGTKIYFTIGIGTDTYEGEAFIDSMEGSGGTDDAPTWSISCTGDGSLTKS